MKKGLFLASICIAIVTFSSCGPSWNKEDNKVNTDRRPVGTFTKLDLSVPADVSIEVRAGATPSLEMTGRKGVLAKVKAEMNGGTLHLYSDEKFHFSFSNDNDLTIKIVTSSIEELSIAGMADVQISGNITGPSFTLSVGGAGDVNIDEINTDQLSIDAAGAADIDIKRGTVRQAVYDLSGAGDVKAYGLQCKEVTASVAGAGDVKVTVSDILSASISGVGNVSYKGHPANVTKSVSGMGSVEDRN